MSDVREASSAPVAGDFGGAGGTPIIVDTLNQSAYAVNASNSVFAIGGGAAVTHSHGNPTLALTNLTGTTASASNGFTLSLSAAAPGGGAAINVSAGATSGNLQTLQFNNSNGVSFGLTGSTITGTVATNYQSQGAYLTTAQPVGAYLTTARASNDAVGLNTALTANGVAWTVNSSGISLNVPAFLTTAMVSNAGSNFAGLGKSTGTTSGTDLKMTVASDGVNISFPKWITTAAASDHSHGNPTLALTNLSGTTASASNGFTLSLSAAAPGAGGGVNVAGGGVTQGTGTVNFANSNGITFGLSNNGTMSASHNGITTARASNDGVGLGTALTAGPLAWTVNSGGISLNAGSAAGTTTGFTGANISASMTHNTAGLALSLSAAAAAGGADKSASFHFINELVTTAVIWNAAGISQRPIFVPFKMGEAITAVNSICLLISRTSGTSAVATMQAGIYTLANATSANLVSSTSFNFSLTTSAQFSGIRSVCFTGLGAMSMSPGQYLLAVNAVIPGTASFGFNILGIGSMANAGIIHPGTNSTAASASNSHILPFNGVYTATTASLPSGVAAAGISAGGGADMPKIFAIIKAIAG